MSVKKGVLSSVVLVLMIASPAWAEVVQSSDTGFRLRHEAISAQTPDDVFARLMEPSQWWDPDHTYSADASNLSMGDTAGSYWREDWDGGSVIHGQVLMVKEGEELVLSAPFGPLISTAAECIWTIKLTPKEGGGTLISSTHAVAGAAGHGLWELAKPVDTVMGNGIKRLAEPR